ncbi:acyl carrier protein [Nocardia jiangsuensis]|uniref:Acyl carrier protein n=1 Tax=Nocardia jiangsuensis TaxID=1691563 RepID=A0ABV8DZF3_9NOCA
MRVFRVFNPEFAVVEYCRIPGAPGRLPHMSTHATDIETVLLDIVRNDLAVDIPAIDRSARLIADLGLDSVAFAVALVAIEERLAVRVSERELIECETVGDVERMVCRHRGPSVSDDRPAS